MQKLWYHSCRLLAKIFPPLKSPQAESCSRGVWIESSMPKTLYVCWCLSIYAVYPGSRGCADSAPELCFVFGGCECCFILLRVKTGLVLQVECNIWQTQVQLYKVVNSHFRKSKSVFCLLHLHAADVLFVKVQNYWESFKEAASVKFHLRWWWISCRSVKRVVQLFIFSY